RRKEILETPLPGRGGLAGPFVRAREDELLGAGKDQEEMEEHGRQEKERDGPGVLHEDVDPPVGGGPQPADEEEQKENAEQEEDARRPIVGPITKDKEGDEEEEKAEDRCIEVGLAPQQLGREPNHHGLQVSRHRGYVLQRTRTIPAEVRTA